MPLNMKEYRGFARARMASSKGLGDGITYNDAYNLEHFGITNEAYSKIERAIFNEFGFYALLMSHRSMSFLNLSKIVARYENSLEYKAMKASNPGGKQ